MTRPTEPAPRSAQPTRLGGRTRGPSASDPALDAVLNAIGGNWRATGFLPARGGQARLFIVANAEHEERIVKIYSDGVEPNAEVLDRVANGDSRFLVRVFQHGIVAIPVFDTHIRHAFEFMEYAKGGSLTEFIQREGPKVSIAKARAIVAQISRALAYIHDEKGLDTVHCDIKPSNILIRSRAPLELVVSDFGASRPLDGATERISEVARTAMYAAPEIHLNRASRSSDLWSLGMMAVEMLAGEHPLARTSNAIIPMRLQNMDVDELAALVEDHRWRLLCRGLLRRTREIRWSSEDIERWLANDPKLKVADEAPAQPQAATTQAPPFPFAGLNCRTPQDLSRALSRDWTAARTLIGRSWRTLHTWVQTVAPSVALALDQIDQAEVELDERLARTIVALDPQCVPNYWSYALNENGLKNLANDAQRGGEVARNALLGLFDSGLLDGLPSEAVLGLRQLVARRWRQQMEVFGALCRAVPRNAPDAVSELSETAKVGACATMLLAALPDPRDVMARLKSDAHTARRSPAASARWFVEMSRTALAGDQPAQLYFIARAVRASE